MMLKYYACIFLKTIEIYSTQRIHCINILYVWKIYNGKVAFKVSELSQFPFMNDSWSSQYGIYVFPIFSAISNI